MKIYEFEFDGGATDWVFAPDVDEAKEFYLDYSGCGDGDGYKVREVPKSEWDDKYLLDINDMEPCDSDVEYNEDDYSNGYKIIESFADYAKHNSITDIIATTEF